VEAVQANALAALTGFGCSLGCAQHGLEPEIASELTWMPRGAASPPALLVYTIVRVVIFKVCLWVCFLSNH
jgi:hypothetical protein